jgi:hypothetical protein
MHQRKTLFTVLLLIILFVELALLVPLLLQVNALLTTLNLSGLEELMLSIQFIASMGICTLAMNVGLVIVWLALKPETNEVAA